MRPSRLLALLAAACAVALAAPLPAAAADPSGGAMAPAEASAETNTGGSVGPADDPVPATAAPTVPVTPRVAPTSTAAAPSTASTVAPTPVSHAAGNAVEPEAGGDEPGTDNSAPLEPLPPSSGQAQTEATAGDSGSSLAMTGGEMVTTLTLGLGFLAAGLAGTALFRRRRDSASRYTYENA
jgi:LPXTG-motif cell wall-anchored protein